MIEGSRPAPCSTVTAGTLTIRHLAGRHGLLLDGEADLNSHCALRDALRALLSDGPGEIHLELAGLTFIDVSCTRELVTLTQSPHPARVILHNPPFSLQRITTLAWPDTSIEVASTSDLDRPGRPCAASAPSQDSTGRLGWSRGGGFSFGWP